MHTAPLKSPLVVLAIATLALYAASCSASHEHHSASAQAARVTAKPAAAQHTFGTLAGLEASQESDEGLTLNEINGKGSNGMDLSIKCLADGQTEDVRVGASGRVHRERDEGEDEERGDSSRH